MMSFLSHHVYAWCSCLLCILLPYTAVRAFGSEGHSPVTLKQIRQYFVAADPLWWDYTPLGYNGCTGLEWDDASAAYTVDGIGSRYLKAIFREYQANFTALRTRHSDEEHLGLLGPLIRAEVGDVIQVVFRNNLAFPVNIEPSGVVYSDADVIPVPPNGTATFHWTVPEQAGPGLRDVSSKLWLYRSTVDVVGHANAGLVGPILISRQGGTLSDGRPADVDREIVTLFQVMNENSSPLLQQTLSALNASDDSMGLGHEEFEESNMMHGINGFVFCNLPGLNAGQGERLRWHVAVEGNEVDLHNAHWHGNVLLRGGAHQDQFSLFPGSVVTADMIADNPGVWLLHCHVNDHLHAGMTALYNISGQTNRSYALEGAIHHHYIAAEEVEWDYAPQKGDVCSREPLPLPLGNPLPQLNRSENSSSPFTRRFKAHYVEYTDASYKYRKVRSAANQYLGFLGPVMRASVGDTLVLHLRNNVHDKITIHAHGMFYHKDSEGAPYNDLTSGQDKLDDAVPPGGSHTYTWFVPERSGPGPEEPSSVMWMYHSHYREVSDTHAGLVGPIIVTRKGLTDPEGRPKDVDREMVVFYNIVDEGPDGSFFYERNREDREEAAHELEDPDKFYTINGYTYCNGPEMKAVEGERLRFYTMSLGTEDGLHNFDLVASTPRQQGNDAQGLVLMPGSMHTVDVLAQTGGDFLLRCRVSEHLQAGMQARLHVEPAGLLWLPKGNGTERVFYVAAESVMWDYAPQGNETNLCTGLPYTEDELVYINPSPLSAGSQYRKAVYRGYKDANFTTPLAKAGHGIMGPLIYAEVGDSLTVVFRNKLPFDVNMELDDGLRSPNDTQFTDPVRPGSTVVYSFEVPEEAGPGPSEMSTVAYTYSSSVDPVAHSNAGLMGTYYIGRQGSLREDGTPSDVDEVIPLLFNIGNEVQSIFKHQNLGLPHHMWLGQRDAKAAFAMNEAAIRPASSNFTGLPHEETPHRDRSPDDMSHGHAGMGNEKDGHDEEEMQEANLKHAINGYLYCNGPKLRLKEGRPVRFILAAFGGEKDMHTPVFRNQVWETSGRASYTVKLMPAVAITADMTPGRPGTWLYHCNVQDHILAGMVGLFEVVKAGPVSSSSLQSATTSGL